MGRVLKTMILNFPYSEMFKHNTRIMDSFLTETLSEKFFVDFHTSKVTSH